MAQKAKSKEKFDRWFKNKKKVTRQKTLPPRKGGQGFRKGGKGKGKGEEQEGRSRGVKRPAERPSLEDLSALAS